MVSGAFLRCAGTFSRSPVLRSRLGVLLDSKLPGRAKRAGQHVLICRGQPNMGCSIPSPSAGDGQEHLRQFNVSEPTPAAALVLVPPPDPAERRQALIKLVVDGLPSPGSRRVYRRYLNEFLDFIEQGHFAFTKATAGLPEELLGAGFKLGCVQSGSLLRPAPGDGGRGQWLARREYRRRHRPREGVQECRRAPG
jgi:hypothetical protein